MKIVIDILDKDYEVIRNIEKLSSSFAVEGVKNFALSMIENATPLSESEDCVSRQAVLEAIGNVPDYDDGMVWEALSHAQRDVSLLPPVTPTEKVIINMEKQSSEPTVTYKGKLLKYAEDGFVNRYCRKNVEKTDSSSENPNKWIPVSERLPNLDDFSGSRVWQKKVLITGYLSFDDTKELFVSEAFAKDVIYNSVHDTVVTAWMPLPKPYVPDTNVGDIYECSWDSYGWKM